VRSVKDYVTRFRRKEAAALRKDEEFHIETMRQTSCDKSSLLDAMGGATRCPPQKLPPTPPPETGFAGFLLGRQAFPAEHVGPQSSGESD